MKAFSRVICSVTAVHTEFKIANPQGGNPENLENLILSTCGNYVPALKGVNFAVAEPQLFPEVGIWHPLAPAYYEDLKEYLNW